MATTFETLERGESVLYGACGGIWVMFLFAKPITKDMLLARATLKTMNAKHRSGFPTLTWVLPQAGFSMDSDARRAAAEVTKDFDSAILGQATLIEAKGFQAAAVRAILSGLDLLSRATGPVKAFSDLEASVQWCAPLRPSADRSAGSAAEIVATLAEVRRGLEAKSRGER